MRKIVVATLFAASSLFAHSALMSCFDNGDGTITCEGGFSDGSSATGTAFKVVQNGKTVVSGKMDDYSEFTFEKPEGEFEAVFDAGEGHQVVIKGSDIAQ
jgi:hypothetical protein